MSGDRKGLLATASQIDLQSFRNHYPTKDNRWVMLGMTNAQTYWPEFCRAVERPELEKDPGFVDDDSRRKNCGSSAVRRSWASIRRSFWPGWGLRPKRSRI